MQWNWPKGWVSSLILGFSAMFISSLLLLHPIRNRSENAWVRAAGKWLYIVLVPLIVVLFLAVTERIGNYGITESRYAGIALGIWLSAQAIYFLFSTSKSIKFTIGSLCLLAFLMSFGPWGMLGVSQRSQIGRLSSLLTKNGVLVDGTVHKEHGEVSQDDAREISSIVVYLNQVHGYDEIRPWFADRLEQDTKSAYARNPVPSDVLARMGVAFIGSRARGGGITFSSLETEEAVEISGYDRLLRRQVITANGGHRFDGDGISYVVGDTLDSMSVVIGNTRTGFDTVRIDIAAFAEQLLRDNGGAGPNNAHRMKPEAMTLAVEQNGQRVKIFFRHLDLSRRDGKTVINSFNADIAYTVRRLNPHPVACNR